jgi:beta-galactosidase/beta-glucuronidase
MNMHRPEYPRPQFLRADWQNLNGPWRFAFDDEDRGLGERWYDPAGAAANFPLNIEVPFVFQSRLSGLHRREVHDILWYYRTFTLPSGWAQEGRRVLLHFGAVDYRAWVWVNGQLAAYHEGGHTPFYADITPFLAGANHLVVRVEDMTADLTQPRGKQYWKEQPEGIFYTPSSGIWQTVWLESVPAFHLTRGQFTPDVSAGTVTVACHASSPQPAVVDCEISFAGRVLTSALIPLAGGCGSEVISLPEVHLWSPEQPALYDVRLWLPAGGSSGDEVCSYFGMRSIGVVDGRVLLNGEPYTMKLVLDQGYFPDGLLTAPSDEALRQDVVLAKAMGFNGVRKHQKVEDPRYLYWADQLGLLVWGEMANAYRFSDAAVARLVAEWQEVIARDYNHPSIVAWVPVNESWGVPELRKEGRQRDFLLSLYHLTRALDSTRLVISNDGWDHAHSDLCTIHDYTGEAECVAARYSALEEALAYQPANRPIYAPGFAYEGQPLLISECGGIAFRLGEEVGWGYSTAADAASFAEQVGRLVRALASAPLLQGYCYTQLTDVEQEINGLLTYDRRPKLPLAVIRAINNGEWPAVAGERDAEVTDEDAVPA